MEYITTANKYKSRTNQTDVLRLVRADAIDNCEQESSNRPMRNRLLPIIINYKEKLAEHRMLSSNELKTNDPTMLLTDPSSHSRREHL